MRWKKPEQEYCCLTIDGRVYRAELRMLEWGRYEIDHFSPRPVAIPKTREERRMLVKMMDQLYVVYRTQFAAEVVAPQAVLRRYTLSELRAKPIMLKWRKDTLPCPLYLRNWRQEKDEWILHLANWGANEMHLWTDHGMRYAGRVL